MPARNLLLVSARGRITVAAPPATTNMKLEIVPREGLPGETVYIASEPSLTNRLSRPEAVDKSAEVMWVTMNRRITSRQDGSTISNNECAQIGRASCRERMKI